MAGVVCWLPLYQVDVLKAYIQTSERHLSIREGARLIYQ